jgi:hypothetical protein
VSGAGRGRTIGVLGHIGLHWHLRHAGLLRQGADQPKLRRRQAAQQPQAAHPVRHLCRVTSFQTSEKDLNNGRRTIQVHDLSEFIVEIVQPAFIQRVSYKRRKLDAPPPTHRISIEAARRDSHQLHDRDKDTTEAELDLLAPSPLSARPSLCISTEVDIHETSSLALVDRNTPSVSIKTTRACAWLPRKLHPKVVFGVQQEIPARYPT